MYCSSHLYLPLHCNSQQLNLSLSSKVVIIVHEGHEGTDRIQATGGKVFPHDNISKLLLILYDNIYSNILGMLTIKNTSIFYF